MKKNLGRKIFKSSAIWPVKLLLIGVCTALFINLYFQTFLDSDFKRFDQSFLGVIKFHIMYPEQIISLVLSTLLPTIYYAFIRGVVFYEKGILFNRGLPFFNYLVRFTQLESFRVIHTKYLVSLRRKNVQEDLLYMTDDMDRTLAILDRIDIKGELGDKEYKGKSPIAKKIIISYLIFFVIVTILQYSGFFIWINQLLFR